MVAVCQCMLSSSSLEKSDIDIYRDVQSQPGPGKSTLIIVKWKPTKHSFLPNDSVEFGQLTTSHTFAHENYPGKRPQTVCVRSVSRKSRDPDALGSREVMVVMK